MRTFSIIDANTGQILRKIDVTHIECAQQQCECASEIIVEGEFDDEVFYYDLASQEKRKRPYITQISNATISGDGVDKFVINGVPRGASVSIDGEPFTIDDGELEITSHKPCRMVLLLDPIPPYREQIIEVIAR